MSPICRPLQSVQHDDLAVFLSFKLRGLKGRRLADIHASSPLLGVCMCLTKVLKNKPLVLLGTGSVPKYLIGQRNSCAKIIGTEPGTDLQM